MKQEVMASAVGTGPAPFGLSPCGSQAKPLVPDARLLLLETSDAYLLRKGWAATPGGWVHSTRSGKTYDLTRACRLQMQLDGFDMPDDRL